MTFSIRSSRLIIASLVGLAAATAHAQLPTVVDPNLAVREVVGGLTTPSMMAFIGANEMLVLEKNTGRVLHVLDGTVDATALDLSVNNASERGLLGIALDPAFASNGYVYLYWTCTATAPPETNPFSPTAVTCPDQPALGADETNILAVPLLGNRVDRFIYSPGSRTLTWDRNLIKLRAFQNDGGPVPAGQGDEGQAPAGNHNGGVITFGADAKLYIIIGDVGRRGWMQNLPQGPKGDGSPDDQFGGPQPDNAHFTGSILRLNPDGSTPADNPFFAFGAALGGEVGANLQKVYAYGFRNSFGMTVDPFTGNLWMQENGDDSYDEINLVAPGMNSGWIQSIGPTYRHGFYRAIETSPTFNGLQQRRWAPENIALTSSEALSRMLMFPGASHSNPEFSWKYAVAPAALGFMNGTGIGTQYNGDLFVGMSVPVPNGGHLLRIRLAPNRQGILVTSNATGDLSDDNLAKRTFRESTHFIFGSNFGVVTDIETGPNGNLFVVSLSRGSVYEIYSTTGGDGDQQLD